MPQFESGVASYVVGRAVVKNAFPVDYKGVADIRCEQCKYFRRTSRSCALNDSICEFPEKYVGSRCPFNDNFEYENKENNNEEV